MKLWSDRRLKLSLTRLGAEYLVVLLAAGAFAANTGNNLLYLVFSFMAALFLVSGWVSRRAIQDLAFLRIEPGSLFARLKGGLRLRLTDRSPQRVRGLELRVELEEGLCEPAFFPGGAGMEEPLVVLQVRPGRRGWCAVRALELRTRHPFGFLEKSWTFPLAEERILILPHPRAALELPGEKGEGSQTRTVAGMASPFGARPFRPGDAPTRVHWKRTAQRGVPWVRTFEDEAPLGLRLALDLQAWTSGEGFERELERLSGLILQARLFKRAVGLELRGEAGAREHQGHASCWAALAEARAEGRSDLSVLPRPAVTD